jgi:hypothetical protein
MEIMSTPISRILTLSSLVCCFSGVGNAAEVVLQKVPPLTVEQAPAYPENLARYHFGAQVEAAPDGTAPAAIQLSSKTEDRNAAPAALLCDDPTIGYALSNGSKTLLITLSKIENIDSVSFLNHGAKGEMTIAISNTKLPADSPQWHVVAKQELAGAAVKAKVGPSEAKYVKLTFNVSAPGRIAALGVYSPPTVASFTMPRARKLSLDRSDSFALVSYNLTDLHAKARALYVSSGADVRAANNMIDDQSATTYSFGPTDVAPTAVIDLGKVTTLRRISALYTPRPGNVDFYVMESLPGMQQGNAPKTLKVGEMTATPVGSVSDGSGRAAIDFPETKGRYIMVKWTPAAQDDTGISVAEIAAFGGNGRANLVAANTSSSSATEDRIESERKTTSEGKDFGDGKDFSKEMPEEGPAAPEEGPAPGLPQPPPFTFVPEILPTSP